jgi:3-methylcrotonyl-CoA carboxylase alpha subunit
VAFTPQTGYCSKIIFPSIIQSDEIKNRFDFAFDENGEVSHFYDSMIGKVIVWAADKNLAIKALTKQIIELKICGVITNTEFILRLIQDSRFKSNQVFTNSLTSLPPAKIPEINDKSLLVAAVIWSKLPVQMQEDFAFRILGESISNLHGQINNVKVDAICRWIQTSSHSVTAEIDNKPFLFQRLDENKIAVNDNIIHFEQTGSVIFGFSNDGGFCIELPFPKPVIEHEDLSNIIELKSTLPGKVIGLTIKPGDKVEPMDTLLTIESMKMEHHVKSPRSGVVEAILVEKSQVVAKNSVLVRFKK